MNLTGYVRAKAVHACIKIQHRFSTHSVSDKPGIQLGVVKLGICIGGRLTDTGRFGTLGICRFTFGRLTLGRLLVKLLWKGKNTGQNDDEDSQNEAKGDDGINSIMCMFRVQDEELIQR